MVHNSSLKIFSFTALSCRYGSKLKSHVGNGTEAFSVISTYSLGMTNILTVHLRV